MEARNHIEQKDAVNVIVDSYTRYALSVLLSRATPDVRDGLKPVQRRVLYASYDLGLYPDKKHKKCARTVGEVLGKYHPRGDSSAYGALVKLAQDFKMKLPLIDGQGNFGSTDGDSAAAMRYTESKLSQIGYELCENLKYDTVDFIDNYDGSEKEPSVLGSFFPNFLVNGNSGIAVGYSTEIPTHNVADVYDALIHILDNTVNGQETNIDNVIDIIKAPDFPTGGQIVWTKDIAEGYRTGKGKVKIKAHSEFEDNKIIFTSIPYGKVKSVIVGNIAKLAGVGGPGDGISNVTDESNKDSVRIVVTCKRGVDKNSILAYLYKHTDLYTSQPIILHALTPDKDIKLFNVLEILNEFLIHCSETITRRSAYINQREQKRLKYLNIMIMCLEDKQFLNTVINTIANSEDVIADLEALGFDEEQANILLDSRLRSISKGGLEKLLEEKEKRLKTVEYNTSIIEDPIFMLGEIRKEFITLKDKYGASRQSDIIYDGFSLDYEDTIDDKNVVISLSVDNCIKSVDEEDYKAQRRGGKGSSIDYIKEVVTTNIKTDLLFFTNKGKCYVMRASSIPVVPKTTKAKSINNYLQLEEDEYIITMLPGDLSSETNECLLFITKNGISKRLKLETISKRKTGIRAISFREDDMLVKVLRVSEDNEVVAVSNSSKGIRTDVSQISTMGRQAAGVKLMSLLDNEYIIDAVVVEENQDLFIISETGYGKTVCIKDIRKSNRGAKGVALSNTKANEYVASIELITKDNELYLITEKGQLIKTSCEDIAKTKGRTAKGVKMIKFQHEDDKIMYVIKDSISDVQ